MKCQDIQFDLAVYFDDILAPAEIECIDKHLVSCPLCRDRLAGYQENRNVLRAGQRIVPNDSLIENIRMAVRNAIAPTAVSPSFHLIEDRRGWFETWMMPSLVGSFTSIILGLSLLWLVLSPVNRPTVASGSAAGPSPIYIASANTNNLNGIDISPLEFASTRLSVAGESPSVNPQGALIALSRSFVRGEMKDEEVVIVADVFGNGLARIAEVVEPRQDDDAIYELRKAFHTNSEFAPFVPASMDRRSESVRVVLKFQSVDVPVDAPGL